MADLRQSTSQIVRFGPFLDDTDGKTPETSLTITQADMQISKDGAAFAQKNTTGNATHDADGFYFTTFDTTDSNTTSIFEFQVNVAGALPFFKPYNVLTQTYFDAKYTGTFNNLGGVAQTADNDTKISKIPLSDGTNTWNATALASINAEADQALTDYDGPTNAEFELRTIVSANYATSTKLATVDTVVDAIKVTTDKFVFTVANQVNSNMLTHTAGIPTNYITSTGIAASALDNKGNWNINKTGYSLTITPPTATQIWAEATRTLTSGTNIVLAKGVGVTEFNDLDFNAIWTGTLTESYAANGVAMTPAQAMHMMWSDLRSPQQVSTTWSDFRLDNTTAVMTFTLDNATTPTKKTRAS